MIALPAAGEAGAQRLDTLPEVRALASTALIQPGGLKSTAIGSMVGLAAGGAGSLVLLMGSRNFFLGQGAPVEMVLQQPLSLQRVQAAASGESKPQQVAIQPIAPRPEPPSNHGTCFTPGTPGERAPDTVIPGAPGPDGVPGPPHTIPGTPPTPGTPYPCP